MSRFAAAVLALALAVTLAITLAGCASTEEKYCDALRKDRVTIDDMINGSSSDALLRGLPLFQDLADQAPDDLTDEWQTFVNALKGLDAALAKADVKASDFKDGKIPASVTGDDRQTIVAAADTLSSAAVVNAVSGIETQGRDVCKVNLGL